MHIYCAAVYTNGYAKGSGGARYEHLNEHERTLVGTNIPHLLESWHYVGKQKFVDAMRSDGAKVFLDSGAFSAHTLGVELKVEDYVDYIYRNWDIIRGEGPGNMMASVLDGIGNADQTFKNQQEMEHIFKNKYGVDWRPLPCFHAGEPEHYLEHYVANYDYITLGGMVGTSTKQLMVWLDRIFDRYLVDGAGNPKVKTHGFGVTAVPVMEAYPWYSCDSSSWIQTAAFGGITTPQWGPMNVSTKSPSRHERGQHMSTLSPIETEVLYQHLEQAGFTYERLSTVYESRAAYNLWAYGVINAMINAGQSNKFKQRVAELF